MKFKAEDEKTINAWAEKQTDPIQIKFTAAGHDLDNFIEDFCDTLAELAFCIKVEKKKNTNLKLPEIGITDNLSYSAVPMEMELTPFLAALEAGHKTGSPEDPGRVLTPLPETTKEILEKTDIPVHLTLFIANACPHCPKVAADILPMAFASSLIKVRIIDGTLFTQEAARASVMSAPCLILDDDFRWTGQAAVSEVADMIVNRRPASLSAATFRSILEEGRASWIANQMIEEDAVFPGFIDLLTHEIWSVRLGAMVVLEELAENNRNIALKAVPLLWEKFDTADTTVKGDILYALGEAGDTQVHHQIRLRLATLENEDLKSAAEDALESIESRS
ncbi:MAG: thioredoxin family protein [Thermodesulfobacteriota bacterium]|nr:thioredoxin family protein [Thermodesulfobacteriota bacterium]